MIKWDSVTRILRQAYTVQYIQAHGLFVTYSNRQEIFPTFFKILQQLVLYLRTKGKLKLAASDSNPAPVQGKRANPKIGSHLG
jgi:hypothetical protein